PDNSSAISTNGGWGTSDSSSGWGTATDSFSNVSNSVSGGIQTSTTNGFCGTVLHTTNEHEDNNQNNNPCIDMSAFFADLNPPNTGGTSGGFSGGFFGGFSDGTSGGFSGFS